MIGTVRTEQRSVAAILVITVVALLVSACSSTNTVSTADPSVDFSVYRTYGFVSDLSTDKEQQYQSLESTQLKKSVSREMEARGLSRAANPDVAINFSVNTQEKVRTRSVPSTDYGVGYDPYHDVYYDGWATTHQTRIDQYTEGKLNIDLIDVNARKLVWQGSTRGRLSRKDEQNMPAVLDSAVTEVFQGFPIVIPGD